MKLKVIADIAQSLLFARWRQSLVAAIGVMFSITMFIALLGFMNGLNSMLDGLILNRTPHIRLYNEIKPADQQPVELSADYADHHAFVSRIKPKDEQTRVRNALGIMQALGTGRYLRLPPSLARRNRRNLTDQRHRPRARTWWRSSGRQPVLVEHAALHDRGEMTALPLQHRYVLQRVAVDDQ